MYPSFLHNMAPFCMNTTKKSSGGGPIDPPPFKQYSFRSYYTHTYWKNHYQNIPATNYVRLRYAKLRKPCPAPSTKPSHCPPPPSPFFFFCFFKNLLGLKINILSSVYPEINFPVIKINNLFRPILPAHTPPLRTKWSFPYSIFKL